MAIRGERGGERAAAQEGGSGGSPGGVAAEEIKAAAHHALQRRKRRNTAATKNERKLFLDELAASCNVRRAAEAAGMSRGAFYCLRRRDPAFAAVWAETLEGGYERLEQELLSAAAAELEQAGDPDAAGGAPVTGKLALDLLRLREFRIKAGRSWRPAPPVPMAEVEAELEKAIERLAKRLGRKRERVTGDAGTGGGEVGDDQ